VRLRLATACFCLLVPALAVEAAPPRKAEPVRLYTIEQLMAADGFSDLSFSPDGRKLLVASARTGIRNLYVMPAEGGDLKPVTNSVKETISSIGYFPSDERILYASDQGGNELNHLYVRELDGTVRDLTPGDKLRARFVQWAPDGASFFAVTNERDPRYFDLYEYSTRDYARKRLFENDKAYQIGAISPDRRYVALSRIADNASTHAYLYDTTTNTLAPLVPETQGVVTTPRSFERDGSAVFYTTDEGSEFQHLVRQDLKTGARTTIFAPDWDVEGARPSKDGRHLIVAVDQDARTVVHLLDAKSFKPVKLDTGPGTISGFTVAEKRPLVAYVRANGDTPGDVHLLDLATGKSKRLLSSLPAEIRASDLVRGEVVRFKSYDGLTVPGILYKPHPRPDGAKPAGVISVHGGPGGESSIGFKPMVQYLVNHGYAVYEINNRGSSGSGKTFNHLDDHKHGDADLDDVVAAKRVLTEHAGVDPAKIAIEGQSYGGFMVLAGLTFRPTEFAAGVDLFGVSNWPRLLQNTPPWWADLNRMLATEMGDWKTEGDYLRSISPSFHADRIQRPLMVLQGANDPRVLPVESEDIVEKVRAKGIPVEYVSFPDEGHGFRKKANQLVAYKAVLQFLDRHVKGVGAAAPVADPNGVELGR
jgi:dipeptidyl aminopeptidase/acylaminoacyl peptidase